MPASRDRGNDDNDNTVTTRNAMKGCQPDKSAEKARAGPRANRIGPGRAPARKDEQHDQSDDGNASEVLEEPIVLVTSGFC